MKRGQCVNVVGRLQTRSYEANIDVELKIDEPIEVMVDGKKVMGTPTAPVKGTTQITRWVTEVQAQRVELVGSGNGSKKQDVQHIADSDPESIPDGDIPF